jgi:DNA-binding MarR family transcriptional regulator
MSRYDSDVNEKSEAGAAPRVASTESSSDDGGPWPGGLVPVDGVDAPRPDRPFRSVGFTISTTGYALARRFREALAPLGLEPREFALLRSLAASEGVTQQAIANQMGVAPSRMVALVDSLEERGLLERRQKPDDRRARALYLTPAGRELLGRAFAVSVRQEEQLTSDLSGEEREQLLDLLSRVGIHVGIPRGVHAAMGHSALADELK